MSRTDLRRATSNSGSLCENFFMTIFQSSNKASVLQPMSSSSEGSVEFEEFNAFRNKSNSTDTTSEEQEECNLTRFFKIFVICLLLPETFKVFS